MPFIFPSQIILLAILQPVFCAVVPGISNSTTSPIQSLDVRNPQNKASLLDVHQIQSLLGRETKKPVVSDKALINSPKTQWSDAGVSNKKLNLLKNTESLRNSGQNRNPLTNTAALRGERNQYYPNIYYDYDYPDYQNGPAFSPYLNRKPARPLAAEKLPADKKTLSFQRTPTSVNSNNAINRGFNFYPGMMDMDCNSFDIPQMCSSSQDCMSPGYCFRGFQGTSGICCFPGYMD